MDIAFDLSTIFTDSIQRLDRAQLLKFDPRRFWAVAKAIDVLGQTSAKSQGLKRVITSYDKVLDQIEDQVIYIMWEKLEYNSKLIGMLKIGKKKLYLTDSATNQYEENPVCILDFYIHGDEQRKTNGFQMFDKMLKDEDVPADQCAYDRPSAALQQFLTKYYSLENPIWQTTKFIVYPDFFNGRIPTVNNSVQKSTRISRASSAASSRVASRTGSPIGRNRPRFDSVADLMRQEGAGLDRANIDPNSATGRKNTRDYGHTRLW